MKRWHHIVIFAASVAYTGLPSSLQARPSISSESAPLIRAQDNQPELQLVRCQGTPSASLEIHVLGEVLSPGTFWVRPGIRADEAIRCAGDITGSGTKRRVVLRRAGQTLDLDLFAYRKQGNLDENPYLSNQDVLYVSDYKNRIRIMGNVKHPGYYELLPNETNINTVIQLAGGFSTAVNLDIPVTILRAQINGKNSKPFSYKTIDIRSADLSSSSIHIQDADILISNNTRNPKVELDTASLALPGENEELPTELSAVFVMGAVYTPGPHIYKIYYSTKDYAYEAGVSNLSNLKKLQLLSRDGTRKSKEARVAPGDIVYIPQRKFTFENALQLWNVATSTFFTGFSVYNLAHD